MSKKLKVALNMHKYILYIGYFFLYGIITNNASNKPTEIHQKNQQLKKKSFLANNKKLLITLAVGTTVSGLSLYLLYKNGYVDKAQFLIAHDKLSSLWKKAWSGSLSLTSKVAFAVTGALIPIGGLGYLVAKNFKVHETALDTRETINLFKEQGIPLLLNGIANMLKILQNIGLNNPVINQIATNRLTKFYLTANKTPSLNVINQEVYLDLEYEELLYKFKVDRNLFASDILIKNENDAFNMLKKEKTTCLDTQIEILIKKLNENSLHPDIINKLSPQQKKIIITLQQYSKKYFNDKKLTLETNKMLLEASSNYDSYKKMCTFNILNPNFEEPTLKKLNLGISHITKDTGQLGENVEKVAESVISGIGQLNKPLENINTLAISLNDKVNNITSIFTKTSNNDQSKILEIKNNIQKIQKDQNILIDSCKELTFKKQEIEEFKKQFSEKLTCIKAEIKMPRYFISVVCGLEEDKTKTMELLEKKITSCDDKIKNIDNAIDESNEKLNELKLQESENNFKVQCLTNINNNIKEKEAIKANYINEKTDLLGKLIHDSKNNIKKEWYEFLLFKLNWDIAVKKDEIKGDCTCQFNILKNKDKNYLKNDFIKSFILERKDFVINFGLNYLQNNNKAITSENFKNFLDNNDLFESLSASLNNEILHRQEDAEYVKKLAESKQKVYNFAQQIALKGIAFLFLPLTFLQK